MICFVCLAFLLSDGLYRAEVDYSGVKCAGDPIIVNLISNKCNATTSRMHCAGSPNIPGTLPVIGVALYSDNECSGAPSIINLQTSTCDSGTQYRTNQLTSTTF